MKFILAVTTYYRPRYLQCALRTWRETRNAKHDWLVLVADDGSPDEQIAAISKQLDGIPHRIFRNNRRGIHYQVNQLLRIATTYQFDFGFRLDDDVWFSHHGWDDAYYAAARATGYHHLVHHDPTWRRVKRYKPAQQAGSLANQAYWDDLQGAFWTFTPQVLQTVGYIDVQRFNLCGFGHRDYTYRCCLAGYNQLLPGDGMERFDGVYDLANSQYYIKLQRHNYYEAPGNSYNWQRWNAPEHIETKQQFFGDNRIYIPYCELPCDIAGQPLAAQG